VWISNPGRKVGFDTSGNFANTITCQSQYYSLSIV